MNKNQNEYYQKNKERILNYVKEWIKNNPDRVAVYNNRRLKKYHQTYKKKYNGYFLYNDTEQIFFKTLKDIQLFLGCSARKVRKVIYENLTVNGWQGEQAL